MIDLWDRVQRAASEVWLPVDNWLADPANWTGGFVVLLVLLASRALRS